MNFSTRHAFGIVVGVAVTIVAANVLNMFFNLETAAIAKRGELCHTRLPLCHDRHKAYPEYFFTKNIEVKQKHPKRVFLFYKYYNALNTVDNNLDKFTHIGHTISRN